MGIQFSYQEETIVGKEEIAHNEQFLLFLLFSKAVCC